MMGDVASSLQSKLGLHDKGLGEGSHNAGDLKPINLGGGDLKATGHHDTNEHKGLGEKLLDTAKGVFGGKTNEDKIK